jgi:hypothetical protein
VNVGGQAILSKSSKELESKLLKDDETDLTRALRPAFGNYIKKGEGAGGGARPSVEREKSIGVSSKVPP